MAVDVTTATPKGSDAMRALERAADFVFIGENEHRVPRKDRVHPKDPAYDCGCRARATGTDPICDSDGCINRSSTTECMVGSCSKRRCMNKRIQRKEYSDIAVIDVSRRLEALAAHGPCLRVAGPPSLHRGGSPTASSGTGPCCLVAP